MYIYDMIKMQIRNTSQTREGAYSTRHILLEGSPAPVSSGLFIEHCDICISYKLKYVDRPVVFNNPQGVS